MSLLHLVRHGQASAGTDNYDRLSPTGQAQSRMLGQWWLAQGFSPHLAVHGTLVRQRDTASLAMQALFENARVPPMQTHAGLNEYDHRIIESHFATDPTGYVPESMAFDDYMGIIERWRDHTESDLHPEIEPWETFKARGWNTLQEFVSQRAESSELVFFTSGGIIATMLATVLDLDFAHTIDAIWRIRNTSITSFQIGDDGKARLIQFNTVPHLQQQNQPQLITMI